MGSEANQGSKTGRDSEAQGGETQSLPKGGEAEAESAATTKLDDAVTRLLKELGEIREDIKRVREEAILKETLANRKLEGIETKFSRQIREATIPTTRDADEFTGSNKPPETASAKIVRLLGELKAKIESGKRFKAGLSLKDLLGFKRAELVTKRDAVASRITEFEGKVRDVQALGLSTEQQKELMKYQIAGQTLAQELESIYRSAIEAKTIMETVSEGMASSIAGTSAPKPTPEKQFTNSTPNEPMSDDQFFDTEDGILLTSPAAPPKPPRKKDTESSPVVPESLVTAPLRLEAINLPTFNGDLTEWSSFRDLFTYLIHNNDQLADIVKFYQLRSKLRGPALDTIKGYQITGVNYQAAWDDLQRRFDRTDNLIQEYIRKFLEVPAILNRPNSHRIRAIIDATNQMTRALPGLGANVRHWDPFICLIISSKLDEETRSDWRQHLGRRTDATIGDLIDFLETRSLDYQPSQSDHLSQMLKGQVCPRNPRRNIFAVTNEPDKATGQKRKCVICKGDHYPWQCQKLRKECARVRAELVNSVGACVKCLLKHEVGACTKSDCPYCGEGHNSMLCLKRERDQGNTNQDKKLGPPRGRRPDKSGGHGHPGAWSNAQ